MAVSITPTATMTANETLDTGVAGAQDPQVSHNGFNQSGTTLNATSTPPAVKASYREYTLSGGAATIDLTALLGVGDESQDATGEQVQTIIIVNPSGNNPMTVGEGATNGYPIFGAGNSITIPAGGWVAAFLNDGAGDVAAADKTIDISGTGTVKIKIGIVTG